MPKGSNQKLKLYHLAQIMLENTDDDHYITMPEIMSALEAYEVTADRRTIYADLKDLEALGIEVEGEPVGGGYRYHVVERPFELPELSFWWMRSSRQIYYRAEDKCSDPKAGEAGQQIRSHEAPAAGICFRADQNNE